MGIFVEDIYHDMEITAESFFPEWVVTDRLRFEQLTAENLPPGKLQQARERNPGFDTYFPRADGLDSTYGDVLEWYELAEKYWRERTNAFYAMFLRETGEFIGMAFLEEVNLQLNSGKLGVWIDKSHRGNEIAPHFVEAFMMFSFTHLDLDIVRIEIVHGNQASIRSAEKYMSALGGMYEGMIRNATETPSDGVQNVHYWSVSQAEFDDDETQYQRELTPPHDQDAD